MGKRIRKVLTAALLFTLLFSGSCILSKLLEDKKERTVYQDAVCQYTVKKARENEERQEGAPLEIDFAALQAENEDIIGWIYCGDTPVNYPVVQGTDNTYYLKHSFDGTYNKHGAIFMDAENSGDFSDYNSIIYGHHRKDNSMFAPLLNWADQDYFEAHPVMWILTPDQDYRVELFSGYLTSAFSDSYIIFKEPCEAYDDYVRARKAVSDFRAEAEVPEDARCIMLSTCAYDFRDARYILHGVLIPVG